ncbi:MAG: hypothetical protein K2X27_13075 [Candidatus Obscuribacterales bacterium]|nr:hypothetical protein [Candidatus Obscuribacterales bacterium]
MSAQRILIVFSDTGAGHRTAANAIKSAIIEICQERNTDAPDIVMEDIIEESNAINRLFAHTYNRILKKHQEWMKYYFELIEWIKPNESNIGYRLSCSYTKKVIEQIEPTLIVSVHPMVNHFLARALKDMGLSDRVKLITVLTDPNANLWTGWACPDASLTIAPNDIARDKLVQFGLDPAGIKVIGMPILPEFLKPPVESREELLSRLALDPKQLTVTITAGSAGGGNMPQIYQALQETRRSTQVIFICGKNEKLKKHMEKISSQSRLKTVVLPFTKSMSDGMNACDLLVTKAGGLTTFEAIARRLPMAIDLLTEPMPQEAGTVDILLEAGLAKAIRQAEDILHIVEGLQPMPNRLEQPLPKLHSLDRVDAVYEIAEQILSFLDKN